MSPDPIPTEEEGITGATRDTCRGRAHESSGPKLCLVAREDQGVGITLPSLPVVLTCSSLGSHPGLGVHTYSMVLPKSGLCQTIPRLDVPDCCGFILQVAGHGSSVHYLLSGNYVSPEGAALPPSACWTPSSHTMGQFSPQGNSKTSLQSMGTSISTQCPSIWL